MQVRTQRIRKTSCVSILAIVVVYRLAPQDSSSLTTLMRAAQTAEGVRLRIIVADNTPGVRPLADVPSGVEYKSYPDNPGLARPYNDALALAAEEGYDWLLTLDQDTDLPDHFLAAMAHAAATHAEDASVAALVPRVEDEGRPISPFFMAQGFWPVILRSSSRGVAPPHASAINSGSLLRVESLLQLGGYDPNFPLHNSDTRLFQSLDAAGKRLAIADVTVQHEFSILRREERTTPERYRLMLEDECRFWDLHMNGRGRLERQLRLLGRLTKGVIIGENAAFQRITLAEFCRRLFTRRSKRIRQDASRYVLPV